MSDHLITNHSLSYNQDLLEQHFFYLTSCNEMTCGKSCGTHITVPLFFREKCPVSEESTNFKQFQLLKNYNLLGGKAKYSYYWK